MADLERLDHVTGDATGLAIPAHGEALRAAGAAFLTRAFHAFGTLAADNEVTGIARFEHCAGGSTGAKFFLTLDYAHPEPGLPRELFVKFSRDFEDSLRDWQRHEMAGEARFAPLALQPGVPIEVPKPLFADYQDATGTGLVITERVYFGEGGIEPLRRKTMDHKTLPEPLPYYRAIITALARLAAAHKSGRLADVEALFPFDPVTGSADPVRDDAALFETRLAQCADFAKTCPHLLPAEVRAPDFVARFAEEARAIRAHEAAIQAYLCGNPDLIALCHWNAHIDNAFFRREGGELRCGLIDWGRVGQITFGSALWGCLSAAHHDIWDHHLDELLALFVGEYRAAGGPAIDVRTLDDHLTLHIGMMAVARVLVFPEVILFRLPEAVHAGGPHDVMFEGVDAARNCLHVYTAMLKHWRRRDIGAAVRRLVGG